jgi:hypothetical protein
LLRNSFEFKIHEEVRDTLGNYDISIQDYRMTSAVVFEPNEDKPCFFETLQSKINMFPNSSLILVGDWNVVQDYNLDTINYRRENNSNSRKNTCVKYKGKLLCSVTTNQSLNEKKISSSPLFN